jgi:hypothetical protein
MKTLLQRKTVSVSIKTMGQREIRGLKLIVVNGIVYLILHAILSKRQGGVSLQLVFTLVGCYNTVRMKMNRIDKAFIVPRRDKSPLQYLIGSIRVLFRGTCSPFLANLQHLHRRLRRRDQPSWRGHPTRQCLRDHHRPTSRTSS